MLNGQKTEESRFSCPQVNLWGLDAIKTKGESVAIVLYMVGARPLREATGRVARYELIPLEVRNIVATPAVTNLRESASTLHMQIMLRTMQ